MECPAWCSEGRNIEANRDTATERPWGQRDSAKGMGHRERGASERRDLPAALAATSRNAAWNEIEVQAQQTSGLQNMDSMGGQALGRIRATAVFLAHPPPCRASVRRIAMRFACSAFTAASRSALSRDSRLLTRSATAGSDCWMSRRANASLSPLCRRSTLTRGTFGETFRSGASRSLLSTLG